jgi:hypothetical protein
VDETTALVGRRSNLAVPGMLTNFYPTYGDANDQVDRVLPVRRTLFQRVIPRYRLSTSETRDQGLGPAFIEAGYFYEGAHRADRAPGAAGGAAAVRGATTAAGGAIAGAATAGARTPTPAPLSPGTGTSIDLFA